MVCGLIGGNIWSLAMPNVIIYLTTSPDSQCRYVLQVNATQTPINPLDVLQGSILGDPLASRYYRYQDVFLLPGEDKDEGASSSSPFDSSISVIWNPVILCILGYTINMVGPMNAPSRPRVTSGASQTTKERPPRQLRPRK